MPLDIRKHVTEMHRIFRVTHRTSSTGENGSRLKVPRLEWVTEEEGKEVLYSHDPETSLWRLISLEWLSLLATEKML
jgi:hypothetical protein